MRRYVSAHVLDVPYHVDREYDYYIPPHLEDEVVRGSIVTVPFGVSNRRMYAVVCELKDTCRYEKVKPITSATDRRFALSEEMLKLCFFMREQVLCTVGEAVRCMLPSAIFHKTEQLLYPTDPMPELSLTGSERILLDRIAEHPSISEKRLVSEFGSDADVIIQKLIRKGAVRREYFVSDSISTVYGLHGVKVMFFCVMYK